MAVKTTGLTLDEFQKLPEEKPPLEFIGGAVSQKMSPKAWHSLLQGLLYRKLDDAGQQGKRAMVFLELRVTFGGASTVLDISVFGSDRIPIRPDGRVVNDAYASPDLAIEIVSPEQSVNGLIRRCLWYVANGVQVALLVDPDDESVLAFRPGHEPTPWHGSDLIDVSDVVPGFDLTVETLFTVLRPR